MRIVFTFFQCSHNIIRKKLNVTHVTVLPVLHASCAVAVTVAALPQRAIGQSFLAQV